VCGLSVSPYGAQSEHALKSGKQLARQDSVPAL
jgi:hypothetical protein